MRCTNVFKKRHALSVEDLRNAGLRTVQFVITAKPWIASEHGYEYKCNKASLTIRCEQIPFATNFWVNDHNGLRLGRLLDPEMDNWVGGTVMVRVARMPNGPKYLRVIAAAFLPDEDNEDDDPDVGEDTEPSRTKLGSSKRKGKKVVIRKPVRRARKK